MVDEEIEAAADPGESHQHTQDGAGEVDGLQSRPQTLNTHPQTKHCGILLITTCFLLCLRFLAVLMEASRPFILSTRSALAPRSSSDHETVLEPY